MQCSIWAWAVISVSCSTVLAADSETAARPIEEADSVLAIYPEDWGRVSPTRVPAIILAIWPDGHVVWSKDRINGGAPYFTGHVDPEKVTTLLSGLEHDGLFADKKLNNAHFGPDSNFTTLLVKSGKKDVKMQSWHERSEANGKAIADSHGASGLNGQRRLDVLRKEPADYLHYRLVWSETRGKLTDLIPNVGTPVSGKTVMKDGSLVWQEAPVEAELPGKAEPKPTAVTGPHEAEIRKLIDQLAIGDVDERVGNKGRRVKKGSPEAAKLEASDAAGTGVAQYSQFTLTAAVGKLTACRPMPA